MATICLGHAGKCDCTEFAKVARYGQYDHCACGCSDGCHVDAERHAEKSKVKR